MLQYLVDDYLGGYGLPQSRKVAGAIRLGMDEKGDRCLINMLNNRPIEWSLTDVVAIRFGGRPEVGTYFLFSDRTECYLGDWRQLGLEWRVSTEKLQLYLVSSE
jgi:hypothetical protein